MKKEPKLTLLKDRERLLDISALVLFLGSVLISILTTYYATGHFMDSDAASELILAEHLSKTGGILSRDWFYSTELRVVNTQLVYAPMFWLFSDWHMVRFASALVLQGIYILSYAFMLKQAGVSRRVFFSSAAILLLPVGTGYGRIVLYHCFYIPHIAISFGILGLFFQLTRKSKWNLLSLALLLGLSFAGGLGGIRQLMITHAPMLVLLVLICFVEDAKSEDESKAALFAPDRLWLLIAAVLAAGASFVGLKVNGVILTRYYSFATFDAISLKAIGIPELGDILYGFFHQFGYRKNLELLSILGILSLGGIVGACYAVYASLRKLLQHTKDTDIRKTLLYTFLLGYAGVMLMVFLLTGEYSYTQYLVLSICWGAVVLVNAFEEGSPKVHPFHVKRIFSWAALLCVLVNGLANAGYYNGIEKFDQRYEGLSFHVADKKDQMEDVVDFLTEGGYDIGYATFWEGNILTEMTDGSIRINNVYFHENGNLSYYDWLCFWELRQEVPQKPFLIIDSGSKAMFEAFPASQYCKPAFDDGYHFVYDITDVEAFKSELYEW